MRLHRITAFELPKAHKVAQRNRTLDAVSVELSAVEAGPAEDLGLCIASTSVSRPSEVFAPEGVQIPHNERTSCEKAIELVAQSLQAGAICSVCPMRRLLRTVG